MFIGLLLLQFTGYAKTVSLLHQGLIVVIDGTYLLLNFYRMGALYRVYKRKTPFLFRNRVSMAGSWQRL